MNHFAAISYCALLNLLLCASQSRAGATLEVVSNAEPQCVFAGEGRRIHVVFQNSGTNACEGVFSMRLYQLSSATAVRLTEKTWKALQVLPQQSVLESALLDFPLVKAKTKCLIQWIENTNHLIGLTPVWVYPTNLLEQLKPLAGDVPLGIFDPEDKLKPLLKSLGLDFTDLEQSSLTDFPGRLAIMGPFSSSSQPPGDLKNDLAVMAKKNIAVVWIQPPSQPGARLKPSFYSVPENHTAVVIVQPELLANLPENPQAQLNLIDFCQLALNPEPLVLPDVSPQP